MKLLFGIILILMSCGIITTYTIKNIQFERGCEGYLKRAADANSVDMAKTELQHAILYMDEYNLKSGYTSVIYTTPDEDVGFWYNNVTKSLEELNALNSNSTSLEKSNMLMKLRETLLDQKESQDQVTIPVGIPRFPNNMLWALINLISVLLFASGGILILIYYNDDF